MQSPGVCWQDLFNSDMTDTETNTERYWVQMTCLISLGGWSTTGGYQLYSTAALGNLEVWQNNDFQVPNWWLYYEFQMDIYDESFIRLLFQKPVYCGG